MAGKTQQAFEETVTKLLTASPKNSSKGDPMKEWFKSVFKVNASVARITEDKQLGNRITEQFAHKDSVVVFVVAPAVNRSSLVKKIGERKYPGLSAVLILGATSTTPPYSYERLLIKAESAFTTWASQTFNISHELLGNADIGVADKAFQVITYGAPGTGKSFYIKEETSGEEVFRTTFHPDSDYATFVGAYKPVMEACEPFKQNMHYTVDQLAAILKKEYDAAGEGSDKGKALAVDLYAEQYFEYLDGRFGKVSLMELVNKAGLTKGYMVGLRDSINVAKYHALQRSVEKRIVYKFIDQVFTKAYIQAWAYQKAAAAGASPNRVYLIIEEINRGNCAQIFGDLFQLLDRKPNGFSDYAIKPDSDFGMHLGEKIAQLPGSFDAVRKAEINALYPEAEGGVDTVDEVLAGRLMLLPDNFYIRATMNTSDQSLFPIDSAFKRRWDWKYVPISKPSVTDWKDRKIDANGKLYDWWDFIRIVNAHIADVTKSEDKQLRNFFVKAPDDTGVITAERFANKVLFYLFNDVFKDWDLPARIFEKGGKDKYAFKDFFYDKAEDGHKPGDVRENVVGEFIERQEHEGEKVKSDTSATPGEEPPATPAPEVAPPPAQS